MNEQNGMDKSLEQLAETYSRQIYEIRGKILDDFYGAYVAQLSEKAGRNIDIQSICINEDRTDFHKTKFYFTYLNDPLHLIHDLEDYVRDQMEHMKEHYPEEFQGTLVLRRIQKKIENFFKDRNA